MLAGCATMAPPPLEERDVPARWLGPVYDEAAIWPNTDWWSNFNDAELSAFIEDVKTSNLDLANNRRNLETAQLALREAGLARWPTPQVTLGDGTAFASTRVAGATVSPPPRGEGLCFRPLASVLKLRLLRSLASGRGLGG
jgi:outer membrane protein TolC